MWKGQQTLTISIHAPHEGERRATLGYDYDIMDISTPAPHGGVGRHLPQGGGEGQKVSIHAPHEGERRA